jgi:hypothetical protein
LFEQTCSRPVDGGRDQAFVLDEDDRLSEYIQ